MFGVTRRCRVTVAVARALRSVTATARPGSVQFRVSLGTAILGRAAAASTSPPKARLIMYGLSTAAAAPVLGFAQVAALLKPKQFPVGADFESPKVSPPELNMLLLLPLLLLHVDPKLKPVLLLPLLLLGEPNEKLLVLDAGAVDPNIPPLLPFVPDELPNENEPVLPPTAAGVDPNEKLLVPPAPLFVVEVPNENPFPPLFWPAPPNENVLVELVFVAFPNGLLPPVLELVVPPKLN